MKEKLRYYFSQMTAKRVFEILILLFLGLYFVLLPPYTDSLAFSILKYISISILTFLVVFYFFKYKGFAIYYPIIFFAVFCLFGFVGTSVFSHDFKGLITLTTRVFSLFVVFYSLVIIRKTRFLIKLLVFSFFAFGIVFCVTYFYDLIRFFSSQNTRLGFAFANPNEIGFYCSIALTLSLFLVLFNSKKSELLFLIFVPLFLLVGISTLSKSFLVVSIASIIILLFLKFKSKPKILILILSLGILLTIAFLFIPIFNGIKNRFSSMITSLFSSNGADTSTIQRLTWGEYSIYLGSKNLIFGLGYNGFNIYSGVGMFSHTNFGEVFCNFGLIGLFLYYFGVFYLIIRNFKPNKQHSNKTNYLPAIIGIMIILSSLLMVFYTDKVVYVLLAVGFCISFEINQIENVDQQLNISDPC